MSAWRALVRLSDLDLLLEEARPGGGRQRLHDMGFAQPGLAAVERARALAHHKVEGRWLRAYEQARRRYGRAVVVVRGRVCQGCFITLPTSATAAGETLSVCESCGRILFRR